MKRVLLKSYIDPDLKEDLLRRATGARVTLSKYVRAILQGQEAPSLDRSLAITALLKVNADQARLGNLLRLALDDDHWRVEIDETGFIDVEALIEEIRSSQIELKVKAKALKAE